LEKETIAIEDAVAIIEQRLDEIQRNLFEKAKAFREENTRKADTWEEFVEILEKEGGFISAHWDGTPETEEKIKELTKATIRCIPFDAVEEEGKCILTGKPSNKRVIFAKSY
ncbi:MAG: proline--tRNA ligase, partial [Bacteroidales bacterium]|nr:proline--tRNA ligase [Bacteroidales bacterium]